MNVILLLWNYRTSVNPTLVLPNYKKLKKKKNFCCVILLLDFDLQMDLITKLLCDNGFDCFVVLIPLRDDAL